MTSLIHWLLGTSCGVSYIIGVIICFLIIKYLASLKAEKLAESCDIILPSLIGIPGNSGRPYICTCNNTSFYRTGIENHYECATCGRIAEIDFGVPLREDL